MAKAPELSLPGAVQALEVRSNLDQSFGRKRVGNFMQRDPKLALAFLKEIFLILKENDI